MFNSIQVHLLVIGIIFPVVATCAVALRFRARMIKGLSLGIDDWTMVLGLLIGYMDNFTIVYGVVHNGLGVSQSLLGGDPPNTGFGKIVFTHTILWPTAIAVIKISILLLYKRIFSTMQFRKAVHALIAITLAWMIGNFFTTIFASTPVSGEWTRKGRRNIDYPIFLLVTGVISLVLDLITLTYPLFAIRRLQISRRKKVFVSGMFLLGALCIVASIVRLPYRVQYLHAVRHVAGGESNAFSLLLIPEIFLWDILEVDLALIAGCLPTFAPLFHRRSLDSANRNVRKVGSFHSYSTDNYSVRKLSGGFELVNVNDPWAWKGKAGYHASAGRVSDENSLVESNSHVIRVDTTFDVRTESRG